MKANLKDNVIRKIENTRYVALDYLMPNDIIMDYQKERVDWHNVLMMVDISPQSLEYSTLVVEKGLHFNLLHDAIHTIVINKLITSPNGHFKSLNNLMHNDPDTLFRACYPLMPFLRNVVAQPTIWLNQELLMSQKIHDEKLWGFEGHNLWFKLDME